MKKPHPEVMMFASFQSSTRWTVSRSIACMTIAAIVSISAASGTARADDIQRPQFRKGLWRFERIIEHVRDRPGANSVLVKEEATRCVDPNVAMLGTFAATVVGSCRSAKPSRIDNRYVFSNRCDYMGPVRTEITAESDVAYTEVNFLAVGPLPRREVVLARRLGDCGSAEFASLNSPGPDAVNQIAASLVPRHDANVGIAIDSDDLDEEGFR